MRIVISLFLVIVVTFLGYWMVLDERKHSQAIAYNQRGNALSELKRYDEAIDHYQQAIKVKSNFAEVYNNLANALRQTGKESIAYYNEAIRLKKDYAQAHSNLGIALSEQGQFEEAIGQYQKALQINPDLFRVHDSLAILLAQGGDLSAAIEHYRQAITLYPGFAKAHNNMGSTLAQQGRFEKAIEHFERALKIDPNYIDARKNLELAHSLPEKKSVPRSDRKSGRKRTRFCVDLRLGAYLKFKCCVPYKRQTGSACPIKVI